MQDYRRLRVWQTAHALALDVYGVTTRLRRRGFASLVSQLQRAAVSIGANIAEGCGRDGSRELAKFLQIALASAHEVEYHLLLGRDLGLLAPRDHVRLAAATTAVKKMLTVLIRRVRGEAGAARSEGRNGSARDQSSGDPQA